MVEQGAGAALREVLLALRDTVVPGTGEAPSASAADPAGELLDEAMGLRVDMLPALAPLAELAPVEDPAATMARLQEEAPALAGLATFLLAGAYFLAPGAREAVGFEIRHEPVAEEDVEDLLAPVIRRGSLGTAA